MTAAHDPEMVKLLIARGADVAAKSKTNFTALMVAAGYYGNAATVKELLAHGAEARSGTGRIELILPEKATFQLEATAERGDAVNDYGSPIQKETEGRTATLRGSLGGGI